MRGTGWQVRGSWFRQDFRAAAKSCAHSSSECALPFASLDCWRTHGGTLKFPNTLLRLNSTSMQRSFRPSGLPTLQNCKDFKTPDIFKLHSHFQFLHPITDLCQNDTRTDALTRTMPASPSRNGLAPACSTNHDICGRSSPCCRGLDSPRNKSSAPPQSPDQAFCALAWGR